MQQLSEASQTGRSYDKTARQTRKPFEMAFQCGIRRMEWTLFSVSVEIFVTTLQE